ncbi:MAG: hypothetical protein K6G50_11015 [bacterium]|nr:hypothetical protein [bacterium]
MTSEEKKRALAMMDYKKCPKCGKLIHKLEWPCGGCIDNKTQRWLGPLFDLDQKIKSKLPNWMLEKPVNVEHYFCSECLARMEVNASSCPECGATLGCKKFSEMSDEEKKWAYKYAKVDIMYGILVLFYSIIAPVCFIIIFALAFSIAFNFRDLLRSDNLEIFMLIAFLVSFISYYFLLAVYDLQKKKVCFDKAKGVKKVSVIGFILYQIVYFLFILI